MYILTQGPTTTRVLGGYGYPGKLLWRAVNQDGEIVDVFLQKRRDGVAAKRFFKRLLKKHRDEPRKIVTDKLRSYGVAHRATHSRYDS
jgi:transposase-like protein